MKIRDAAAADASSVGALLTELGTPASTEVVAERLTYFDADPLSKVQVAEVADGGVVGMVATHVVPFLDNVCSCRILEIVVTESHRRRGIGTALVQAAEVEAVRQGCPRLDLGTPMNHTDAHAFYETLGFEGDVNRAFRKLL